MIMKKLISLTLIAFVAGSIWAQSQPAKHEWKATVKVVDKDGNPVAGAKVGVGYFSGPMSTPSSINGLTDTNGIFIATHFTQPGVLAYLLSFRVEKSGYYPTWAQCDLGPGYNPAKWDQALTLTLKKIVNPIPMYARRVQSGPPVFNKPVGYDLEVGDWVAPYGKGVNTDIIFTGHLKRKAKNDFDYKLVVSFPNKRDGIQPFTPTAADKASAKAGGLLSPYEAPVHGYQPQVIRTMSHHPGQVPNDNMNNPNRDYFFRVRTVLDPNGHIKSALYGKIYGDFMQFSYYLDPTPNDRNVEFIPGHSLLGGVPSFDQVSQP